MSLADLRRDYALARLDESEAAGDPVLQFQRWFDQASHAEVPEPNAMTLATATPEGIPSARVVLLKGLDQRGFVFFTDQRSRKGLELEANPRASLVFYWTELERQVRVDGTTERVEAEESDRYFSSRPRGSRLGAWASEQSRVIPDRQWLESRYHEIEERYRHGEPPRPEYWGGYRVVPQTVEFWQGRRSRLHDRLRYSRSGDRWRVERLSP